MENNASRSSISSTDPHEQRAALHSILRFADSYIYDTHGRPYDHVKDAMICHLRALEYIRDHHATCAAVTPQNSSAFVSPFAPGHRLVTGLSDTGTGRKIPHSSIRPRASTGFRKPLLDIIRPHEPWP